MANQRSAYELSESQVSTPENVITLFWRLTHQYRQKFKSVLDLGAGDCRFAIGGSYNRYVGVEIDKKRVLTAKPPINGKVINECAFKHKGTEYDACIGNPPYVRHHDIQSPWKERTAARLEQELDINLDKHCNLYIYFFCLGLTKTCNDGILALVIPYEWVSRPATKALRDYIHKQKYNVSVYRFQMPIFENVMTTASISIIDKSHRDNNWKYFDITPSYQIIGRNGITISGRKFLDYEQRGKIWALRGLSPGSQRIFTLTEGERIRVGLKNEDVVPCVTTLRHIPKSLRILSRTSFQKHFVKTGERCWLIRSDENERSKSLDSYLNSISKKERQTYTCNLQTPWYKFQPHPKPQLLFSSGFTSFGPKVLINSIGAIAIGSVWGIHSNNKLPLRRLQTHLLDINIEERIVAHAKSLKKIEIRQFNTILNKFDRLEVRNGRNGSR
jgi:hypothetical protein